MKILVRSVSTTPFSLVDEFAHLAEIVGECMSLHFEVKVAGRIDVDRLRTAVGQAVNRHPLARARKAPSRLRRREWMWELPERPDVDPVVDEGDTGVHGLAAARARAINFDVPLDTSPPFRTWVVRMDDGDVLVFATNHSAFDAVGLIRLVHSIARSYAGQPDLVPDVDPLVARDISASLGLEDAPRAVRLRALARLARDPGGPPARVAKAGASRGRGVGALVRVIPQARASAPGMTVTDVLVAAMHRGVDDWNQRHDRSSRRIAVYVPINLRDKAWRHEIVGNFSVATSVATMPSQRVEVGATNEAVVSRMRHVRDRSAIADLSPAMFALAGLPLWIKRGAPLLQPLAGRALDTAVLTNPGRIAPIDFGGSAGPVTSFWGSPAIQMPLGAGIMVTGLGEELALGLRYASRQFDAIGAEAFIDCYIAAIDEVSSLGGSAR